MSKCLCFRTINLEKIYFLHVLFTALSDREYTSLGTDNISQMPAVQGGKNHTQRMKNQNKPLQFNPVMQKVNAKFYFGNIKCYVKNNLDTS